MAISTGIGLISGIPIEDTVNQLMALESQPLVRMQGQIDVLNEQRTALLELSARLLSMKLSTNTLSSSDAFSQRSVTSSNENVLTATAMRGAAMGSYNFSVKHLVQSQQMISQGYVDSDTTAVGAGTIRLEAGGFVDAPTSVDFLHGMQGIQRGSIHVTDRSGDTATIDLSAVANVQDVLDAINYATDINVTATVSGDHLVLTDNTGQTAANLQVQEIGGGTTATDLGILDSVAADTLTGTDLLALSTSMRLDSLNGGIGIGDPDPGLTDLVIRLQDGTRIDVKIHADETVQDVLDSINNAPGNETDKITATVAESGGGFKLIDNTAGGDTFRIEDHNGTGIARNLGIQKTDGDDDGIIYGDSLMAGLNTVRLESVGGGTGIGTLGSISITDRSGATATVDLSGAKDLSDVIAAVNAEAGIDVTAQVAASRNSIELVDTTGATASNLIVADVGGSTVAADLGLTHDAADTTAGGTDLDINWFNQSTRLDSLNGGEGVFGGQFKITTRSGATAVVDLSQGNETTIADVIAEINSRGIDVTAAVNAAGDGLLITDNTTGASTFKITEVDGTTAADLNILAEDEDADGIIDGSFEYTLTIEATDTLQDIRDAINDSGAPISASIISDGSASNPYRLSLAATGSGTDGQFLIDAGETGLDLSTLVRARDAAVVFGDGSPGSQALFVSSSTNSITGVVPGVTLDLVSTSDSPVTVSVTRNTEAIVTTVSSFVASYNELRGRIDELGSFNSETMERGLLFSNSTLRRIESAMAGIITRLYGGSGDQFRVVAQMGIHMTQTGTLTFEETELREGLAEDFNQVETFFATETAGFADTVAELIDDLTDAPGGTIVNASDGMQDRADGLEDRMERMGESLARKRDRLYNEFIQLEIALSRLQTQQSYLSSIRAIQIQPSNQNNSS